MILRRKCNGAKHGAEASDLRKRVVGERSQRAEARVETRVDSWEAIMLT